MDGSFPGGRRGVRAAFAITAELTIFSYPVRYFSRKAWKSSAKTARRHHHRQQQQRQQHHRQRGALGWEAHGSDGARRENKGGSGTSRGTGGRWRHGHQEEEEQESFGMEEESQIVTYGEQYNPATGWIR